jgi:hypothetical protein
MFLARLFVLALLLAAPAAAQGTYPGLRQILSEAEWKRAGLDRLTPDQLGVIDAALIRFQLAEARGATPTPESLEPPPGASPAEATIHRARAWDRFGLDRLRGDWRGHPPMKAKVTSWQGANKFALDLGQVWEGLESIPWDILGQEILIEPRPLNGYALKIGPDSMAVRVRRVR